MYGHLYLSTGFSAEMGRKKKQCLQPGCDSNCLHCKCDNAVCEHIPGLCTQLRNGNPESRQTSCLECKANRDRVLKKRKITREIAQDQPEADVLEMMREMAGFTPDEPLGAAALGDLAALQKMHRTGEPSLPYVHINDSIG